MFGDVVSFVVGTCSPFNFELLLALTVLEPVVSHFNGFAAALFHGLVGNADSCGVVTSHWCWRLGVPHFFECDANWNDACVVFDGTIVVVNAEGAKPVMRAVTTLCAGLNQGSGVCVKL